MSAAFLKQSIDKLVARRTAMAPGGVLLSFPGEVIPVRILLGVLANLHSTERFSNDVRSGHSCALVSLAGLSLSLGSITLPAGSI